MTPEQLEKAVSETRILAQTDPARTVIDVILSQGLMGPEEVNFVKDSIFFGEHPSQIGGFELIEKIGEGAMGVVYKARQASMDRIVALKILSPRLARSPRYVARFTREARVVAHLNHPGIVAGIDVGEDQGYHYFAMEFVEGHTVQEILDEKKTIPEKRAIVIAIKVAEALGHAWDRGLVHRDVKPANIVITKGGRVKIADLGLAKYTQKDDVSLTDTGTTVGTAYYISPEQARGDDEIDIRTDIYSLGATLYHMVTGEPPYKGTPVSVMTQHVSANVPDARARCTDVSEGLSDIIAMMMAKVPCERYRSPSELIIDLKRVLEGKPPLLIRTDAGITLLSDAAKWEDEAKAEAVTPEEMQRLKRDIGWGHRGARMSVAFTIMVVILALLAMAFSILYYLKIL